MGTRQRGLTPTIKGKTMRNESLDRAPRYFLRFDLFHRLLHGFLMFSFLGLAASGMPLRFNQAPWATALANAMGGFGAVLFFHKTFALVLTLCFLIHVGTVLRRAFIRYDVGVFFGPNSLVPQLNDFFEMLQHFRWFFGRGPRPRFGPFTYWEKFDYWAVFWGMLIIGTSGFMMWFSAFFGSFLPGWLFNIALLIHADEALLAVWFIFTIHFFNSHLRPEKFPIDLVIFTGRVSERELREERPAEYEKRLAEESLAAIETDPPPLWLKNFGKLIGFFVVACGFVLFGLTLFAFITE
jgi:cytochrome b subunit of formate dehydrogenase